MKKRIFETKTKKDVDKGMKITNLIENIQGSQEVLFEHGLCFYIETAKHEILADCGQTDAFLKNAETLQINLKEVDTVFLSHGHYDHSGGILPFAEINPQADIYMQKKAMLPYYHKTDDEERYIGIDPVISKLTQVKLVDGDRKIDEELSLFSNVTGRTLWPKGNLELKKKTENGFVQDEFDHEQYLVVTEGNKRVLFSGCAHNGILNILAHYYELYGMYPDAVVSGFHMKKKEYTTEDDALITETAKQLLEMPTRFYTGHCTGEYAFAIMKEIMGSQLTYVHSGDSFIL